MDIRKKNFAIFVDSSGGLDDAAELLGYTPGYLSQIKNSRRPITEKSARKWELLAGLPAGWFDVDHTKDLSSETEAKEAGIEHITQGDHANVSVARGFRPNEIPLISSVAAGNWCESPDEYHVGDAEDWLPKPQGAGPNTFALKVDGDSMTSPFPGQRSYPNGMIIYVDPDKEPIAGRRVVAKIPGTNEATFKTLTNDAGALYLTPINPQYNKIKVNNDVLICGVVIGSYLPE